MIYLWLVVPSPTSEGMASSGFIGTLKKQFGTVWKSIFLIWLVMVIRAVVGQSFMTFMPVLLVSRGYSLVSGGFMITLFTLAGTASGLLAGYLADRIGSRPIFLAAHLMMTPGAAGNVVPAGRMDLCRRIHGGLFHAGHAPLGGDPGPGTGTRGTIHGVQPDDGAWPMDWGGAMAPLIGRLADLHSVSSVLGALAFVPLVDDSLDPVFSAPTSGSHGRMNAVGKSAVFFFPLTPKGRGRD